MSSLPTVSSEVVEEAGKGGGGGGGVDAASSELLEHSGVKRCVIAVDLSKSVLEKV